MDQVQLETFFLNIPNFCCNLYMSIGTLGIGSHVPRSKNSSPISREVG